MSKLVLDELIIGLFLFPRAWGKVKANSVQLLFYYYGLGIFRRHKMKAVVSALFRCKPLTWKVISSIEQSQLVLKFHFYYPKRHVRGGVVLPHFEIGKLLKLKHM